MISEEFLDEVESKFKQNMLNGFGGTITQWQFEVILNKYRK